jgi:S-(hydroxymethyl)glutathione dehydrogenase/alcohol dehydrogenase
MHNLCDRAAGLLTGGTLSDSPSYRMSLDGQPVGQMVGLATFNEYTTVHVDKRGQGGGHGGTERPRAA